MKNIGFLQQGQHTAEIQEEDGSMSLHARNRNPAEKQKQKKNQKLLFNCHKFPKLWVSIEFDKIGQSQLLFRFTITFKNIF